MTDQNVLEVVERIVGDDFCVDLDCRAYVSKEKFSDDLKTAHEKLSMIYRIVHSAATSHSCHYVHDDWRKEAEEIYKVILEEGELPKSPLDKAPSV